uniref:Uncharacterized protein n=1 Tax=Rhodnius prolixus TaxID=13249 RepID=T1I381_RHOPR
MLNKLWKNSLKNNKKSRCIRKSRNAGKKRSTKITELPRIMLVQAETIRGWFCNDTFTSVYDGRSSGDFIVRNKVNPCTSSTVSVTSSSK